VRSAAPYLVPLLLSSFAFAQEPDPADMVAQIFEETRAESEAIWRTYCAANEDLGFSGVISDLPDWDHYVERLDSAAFKRLAEGVAPGDGKHKYGSHAMNVAMGRLRCEWLPERQLVRVWGDQEGVAREPWEENYVRVVQNDVGEWRLASWPPEVLEDLFSERSRLPHRLTLTLDWWPAGEVPAFTQSMMRNDHGVEISEKRSWFQLEYKGELLLHADSPEERRWDPLDQLLKDIVWKNSRLGEHNESLDGVLIRVPAAAPSKLLLELLAQLGEQEHRIPDVQLWVTGSEFPEYLYLNQRGAWLEAPATIPLLLPADFSVADAVSTAKATASIHRDPVALVTPWTGPGPDPGVLLRGLDAKLAPIFREFWQPWNEEHEGLGGISQLNLDEPRFVRLCDRAYAVIAPHLSADFPRIDSALAKHLLGWRTMFMGLPFYVPLVPSGGGWLTQGHVFIGEEIFARAAYRVPYFAEMSPPPVAFLRLESGAWKIYSWWRDEFTDEQGAHPHQPGARVYVPSTLGALRLELRSGDTGLRYEATYQLEVAGTDVEALAEAFEVWLESEYEHSHFSSKRDRFSGNIAPAILFEADHWAPQSALAPLLRMMTREDCYTSELRLQVVLDDLGRPGETVFDQSLTRPGADAAGSVGVPLEVDKTIQQLCDRVDRLIAGGATRFHLLPPQ